MRYREIVEATTADKAQKVAQKRATARQKFADVERKESGAVQVYKGQLRKANDTQHDAQAAMLDMTQWNIAATATGVV